MTVITEAATLADVPDLVDVFLSGFNDELFAPIFPPTTEGRAFLAEAYTDWIKSGEDRQPSKVAVIRNADGRVISSAAYWMVRPGDGGLWSWRARWPAAGNGMNDELLEEFFKGMQEQHHGVLKDAEHIYLEILCTVADERKKGYGSALLQLVSDVADAQDQILYLDAVKDAKGLYEKHGYAADQSVDQSSPLAAMVRQKKSQRT